jgi:hypothetical protein
MKLAESVIAWTPATADSPTTGMVRVGALIKPDQEDWTASYLCTGGGAYLGVRKLSKPEAVAWTFIEFHLLVARDGIPVDRAHNAFLAIEEYVDNIPPDMRPKTTSENASKMKG